MCKDSGHGSSTELEWFEGGDGLNERAMRWPEDSVDGFSWLYQLYDRWTFSYMGPVLIKGKNQTLKTGTHLTQNDLYRVPDDMRSTLLSAKFR
jgi:hypothetical protein